MRKLIAALIGLTGVVAVLLGPANPARMPHQTPGGLWLAIRYGQADDKLVCKRGGLSWADRARLRLFFHTYAAAKRCVGWVRRNERPTRFGGLRTD